MNKEITGLYPKRVWRYFAEILEIPRPSKKEEQIIAYLMEFGRKKGLELSRDDTGNLLIRKPPSDGFEDAPTVVLQSHVDMVGEKNSDVRHDFEKDPIKAYIDGPWVKAQGTTLGADDGIGIAAQLAILESENIGHGPIECLFTVDEETGLTGAFGLKPGWLKGAVLINLDSEDEGELFIGCAGGVDTLGRITPERDEAPSGWKAMKVSISGLIGGHSGDDIHKGRANAVKLINRFLWNASGKYGIQVSEMRGGNLRNAIAREAFSVFCYDPEHEKELLGYVREFSGICRSEYSITEPGMKIGSEETEIPDRVLKWGLQEKLLHSIYACPHGVHAWSSEIPGFVETSTNLASVILENDEIVITTSQRSSVESAKKDIRDMVASALHLGGAEVDHSEGYPGWTPNPDSIIVKVTADSYRRLFNTEPKVLAIHAGLECGLIGSVYPDMDMISIGPTIKGAHSPDERLDIKTVGKFWDLLLDVLKKVPEAYK